MIFSVKKNKLIINYQEKLNMIYYNTKQIDIIDESFNDLDIILMKVKSLMQLKRQDVKLKKLLLNLYNFLKMQQKIFVIKLELLETKTIQPINMIKHIYFYKT